MILWWPGIALGAVLSLYSIYWALSLTYGVLKVTFSRDSADPIDPPDLPRISVVIPARDEAEVVGRTVQALDDVSYPRDKLEVIFVEDGSTDGTLDILRSFASTREWMRVYHVEGSGGKAAAINFALGISSGDLIYVLDADSIPERDSLLRIAGIYSTGAKAMAGRYAVANAGESVVSRMVILEELVWRFMCEGRSWLHMPCPPPAGANYAVDRKLLLEIGGLKEGSLAEDAALASALVGAGVRPVYSGVVAMVSAPTTLRGLFAQRIRWYRGYLEAMADSVRRLRSSRDRLGTFDLVLLFSSPVFAMLGLINIALNAWIAPWIELFLAGLAAATLALWAYMKYLGGYYGRESGAAWLAIPYSIILSIISSAAVLMHAARAKRSWNKGRHSSYVDPGRIPG